MRTNTDLVRQFIQFINEKNLDEMFNMLDGKHIFIDSSGNELTGLRKLKKAWIQYFELVPDYKIDIAEILSDGNIVAIFGLASGSIFSPRQNSDRWANANPSHWQIPAAWKAIVENETITLWQVYADNEPIRRILSLYDE